MPHEIEDCDVRMGLAVNMLSIDAASAMAMANGIAIAFGSEDAIESTLRSVGMPEAVVRSSVMEAWRARQEAKVAN